MIIISNLRRPFKSTKVDWLFNVIYASRDGETCINGNGLMVKNGRIMSSYIAPIQAMTFLVSPTVARELYDELHKQIPDDLGPFNKAVESIRITPDTIAKYTPEAAASFGLTNGTSA